MKRADITEIFPDATAEQIQKIMDISGADINAAKKGADDLRGQLNEANEKIKALEEKSKAAVSNEELQKATERAAALETELNGLKMSNQLREIREAVAKEKGIPAELLTGDDEDACKNQADAILAFAKPQSYPNLRDSGEAHNVNLAKTRDKFAEWAKENL